MKTKTQVSAVLIAALLATTGATTVFAQNAGDRDDRRAEMFAELDADSDGSVTAEEFANRPSRFDRVDVNNDGLLSAQEMASAAQARSERHVARMIERLDENGDGFLSQEEVDNRRNPMRMFERLDANNDGVVSEEEFAELRMKRGGGGKRHGKW